MLHRSQVWNYGKEKRRKNLHGWWQKDLTVLYQLYTKMSYIFFAKHNGKCRCINEEPYGNEMRIRLVSLSNRYWCTNEEYYHGTMQVGKIKVHGILSKQLGFL